MKTLKLIQGTPEWHAHRVTHRNASEASVMLGKHPTISRSELVKIRATGIESEVSDFLQRIFDEGHRFEALARPLAEKIVEEDLYPCVGVHDDGRHSASFDGLTMLEDTVFEHKMLNATLREAMFEGCTGAELPIYHQIQMEQQCMVSGADRALFMASEWDGDVLIEERHCWYTPNPALREQIVAGWNQFEADVAAYVPVEAKAAPVPAPVPEFGALSLRVEGRVLASNLDAFKANAEAFIARLPKPAELQTDQDFADADAAVKACEEAEARIKAALDAGLAQMADVDTVLRTGKAISEMIRAARLALDRVVKAEKENRRAQIVQRGVDAVQAHFRSINATLGEHALLVPASLRSELGAAIKSKRTIDTLNDAVDTTVAGIKIAASQQADRVRANVAILAEHADHASLFADRVQLCATKAPEDLRNLIAARIADHQRREAERQERDRADAEAAKPVAAAPSPATVLEPVTANVPTRSAPAPVGQRIKLGDINARIAPMTITAEGLASLGFQPIGTERAAKLYAAADFQLICNALANVITRAAQDMAA